MVQRFMKTKVHALRSKIYERSGDLMGSAFDSI